MLQKIPHSAFAGHGPIQILYPGASTGNTDTGIGSIGRIDHAFFKGRQRINMHPHVNDEILSYFRSGKVHHTDSEGFHATIGGKHLMLMKAGKLFYHEEDIDGEAEPQEGLQIFIRPGEKDLKPEVIFQELEEFYSDDKWRLLASPTSQTAFRFSSQTWLYDVKLSAGSIIAPPEMPGKDLTALLYVYQGAVTVNQISLGKQEALLFRDEEISIQTEGGAELVLFLTDEEKPIYKDGMFSGNKFHS